MTTTDSSPASSQTSSQPAVPAAAVATPVAAASSAAAAPATTTPAASAAAPAAASAPAVAAPPAAAATAAVGAEPKPGEQPAAVQPPAVPEAYDFALPQTDTFKGIELNKPVLDAMVPAFKEANLTQAQLSKILPAFVELQKAQPAAMLARDLEVTMKDPAVGGMNWGKTQGYVNDALAAFTSPEFRQKLERWGIANDLEFVRVFAAVGKAMQGDAPARGQPAAAEPTTRAQRMYGKTSGQQ